MPQWTRPTRGLNGTGLFRLVSLPSDQGSIPRCLPCPQTHCSLRFPSGFGFRGWRKGRVWGEAESWHPMEVNPLRLLLFLVPQALCLFPCHPPPQISGLLDYHITCFLWTVRRQSPEQKKEPASRPAFSALQTPCLNQFSSSQRSAERKCVCGWVWVCARTHACSRRVVRTYL